MLQPYLEVVEEAAETQQPRVRFTVRRFPCIVGRHPDCDRRLDFPFVSRHHCRLFLRDGTVWLEDLASHNGTFLNEERVTDVRPVRDGDRVASGHLLLRVSLSERSEADPAWANAEATEAERRLSIGKDEAPPTKTGSAQTKLA